jgi:hypothetical protein
MPSPIPASRPRAEPRIASTNVPVARAGGVSGTRTEVPGDAGPPLPELLRNLPGARPASPTLNPAEIVAALKHLPGWPEDRILQVNGADGEVRFATGNMLDPAPYGVWCYGDVFYSAKAAEDELAPLTPHTGRLALLEALAQELELRGIWLPLPQGAVPRTKGEQLRDALAPWLRSATPPRAEPVAVDLPSVALASSPLGREWPASDVAGPSAGEPAPAPERGTGQKAKAYRQITAELLKEVEREMRRRDATLDEICEQKGVSRWSLRDHITEEGVLTVIGENLLYLAERRKKGFPPPRAHTRALFALRKIAETRYLTHRVIFDFCKENNAPFRSMRNYIHRNGSLTQRGIAFLRTHGVPNPEAR